MPRHSQTARVAICALVFVVFASVGASMIGVIGDHTDWMAVGDPVAKVSAVPDDHPMGIPEIAIPEMKIPEMGTPEMEMPKQVVFADDPGDHAVVLNFADGQIPRIFDDGAIGPQLGAGEGDEPPGFAPSSSVEAHANRGGVIDLFLAVDDEPGGAVATTRAGATTAIPTVLVASAENAPIYHFIPIAGIDPGEKSAKLELGREGDPPRQMRDSAR